MLINVTNLIFIRKLNLLTVFIWTSSKERRYKMQVHNLNLANFGFKGSKEINQKLDSMKPLSEKSEELHDSLIALSLHSRGGLRVVSNKYRQGAIDILQNAQEIVKQVEDEQNTYLTSAVVKINILNELVQAGVGFADAKEFVDDGAKISEYLMFRPGGEIHDECYGEDELSPLLSYLAVKNGCFRNVNSFLDFVAMYEKLGDECEAKIYSDKGSEIDDFISFVDGSEDEFDHDYSVYKPSIISNLLDKKYEYTYFHEVKQKQVKEALLPEEFIEEFQDEIMAFATPEERIAYLQENLK